MNKQLENYIGLIFFSFSVLISIYLMNTAYNKYKIKGYEKLDIINKLKINEDEIKDLKSTKKELEDKIVNYQDSLNNKKDMLATYELSDNDFKKIMYKLAQTSGLRLINMTKKQKISNFFDYKLYYSNIKLKGDLISLGKFLYYINKIPYHIDTEKFTLNISGDVQILNLGYLQKGDEND